MCGICGVFDFKSRPVESNLVNRMSTALRHRGPDGHGAYVRGPVGLGHRRLSIIDLDAGHQPMTNEDETLQIVFNGEIYNFVELREELKKSGHIFKTQCDTEVILHGYEQWGTACVNRFNGIFAFALWDCRRNELLVARDHLGVKPLYYTRLGDRLLFASEIKALLQDASCPREVDLRALGQLFTLRFVASPSTLFRGIMKLPPAHLMRVSSSGCEIKRYWSPVPEVSAAGNETECIEEYRALVEDSVRLQMRSDVPVGLFLSSGVDSGSLLALMSQYSERPVHTFTIGFEGGELTNENEDARTLAKQFGAGHTDMIVSHHDYERYYEHYLWDLEEPVGNETAAAFYFVSVLASRQVKVALTGQGVDELWAGYDRYIGIKLSALYSQLPSFVTQKVIKGAVQQFSKNERLLRGVQSLDEPDILSRLIKVYSFYTPEMKQQLFQPWLREQISVDGSEARTALERIQVDVRGLDPLTQMLYVDTRASLPDDLLMVADKTAMANSIEARVPFLDYRLIEFIETLPVNMKVRGFKGKYLHNKAAEKWLPKSITQRKKKGFENPIDNWLRAQMKKYLDNALLGPRAAVNRYFNPEYVRQLISDHQHDRQNHSRQIHSLIAFELWHQRFIQ
jgi:asparagine synthase (glutamine-hydrolysing)